MKFLDPTTQLEFDSKADLESAKTNLRAAGATILSTRTGFPDGPYFLDLMPQDGFRVQHTLEKLAGSHIQDVSTEMWLYVCTSVA